MIDEPSRQYQFDDFILEVAERRLLRVKQDRVDLSGKPFDLLVYLVEHPGQLLTRDTLLKAVWGETHVADASLNDAISRVRKALDPKNPQRLIQTIAGQGYRFVGKVEALPMHPAAVASRQVAEVRRTGWRRYLISISVAILAALAGMTGWRSLKSPQRAVRSLYDNALQSERSGDDALAVSQLRQVLALDPNNGPAKLRIAWILYQDNQNQEAANFLPITEKAGPASAAQLGRAALRAMLAGDKDDAQQQLELALESDPDNVETLEFLIENEINRLQLQAALTHVSRCLQLDPQNPFCYFQKLDILNRRNDFDGALSAYKTAVQATHDYPWLHEQAGYAFLGLGRLDRADQEFNSLRETGKRFASAVHFRASQEGLAQVFLVEERYDEARRLIEDALSRSSSISDKADYHVFLAAVEALQGHFAEAQIQANVACADSPCSDDERNAAARVLVLAQDFQGVRAQLAVLRRGPLSQSDDLLATERFLEGSEALFHSHDSKAAVSLLIEARNADPDPLITYVLAEAWKADNDPKAAQGSLSSLLNEKGNVLLDSFACLLPLAEKELHTMTRP